MHSEEKSPVDAKDSKEQEGEEDSEGIVDPTDYEVDPAGGTGEYKQSYWFVSSDGKVVIEPHDLTAESQTSAVVVRITQDFTSKTLQEQPAKRECLIVEDNWKLDRQYYLKWKDAKFWSEDPPVSLLLRNQKLSLVVLKSKLVLFFCM
jgi:hypothetical protein